MTVNGDRLYPGEGFNEFLDFLQGQCDLSSGFNEIFN